MQVLWGMVSWIFEGSSKSLIWDIYNVKFKLLNKWSVVKKYPSHAVKMNFFQSVKQKRLLLNYFSVQFKSTNAYLYINMPHHHSFLSLIFFKYFHLLKSNDSYSYSLFSFKIARCNVIEVKFNSQNYLNFLILFFINNQI
jgi:hypothetical protein